MEQICNLRNKLVEIFGKLVKIDNVLCKIEDHGEKRINSANPKQSKPGNLNNDNYLQKL